jgi:hypothetical protein
LQPLVRNPVTAILCGHRRQFVNERELPDSPLPLY